MNNIIYYLVMFSGVFIASISQILLKKAALKKYKGFIGQYLNVLVITGYSLMLISTVCTVIAMKKMPISTVPIWNSLGMVLAVLWGRIIFAEKISTKRKFGIVIVLLGIMIFGIQI